MKIKCKCGRELEIEWIEKSKQEENCCEMPEEFVSKVNEIINNALVSNSEEKKDEHKI